MNFRDKVKMHLGINEMSLPIVQSAEEASSIIMKYGPLVNAGKAENQKGDYRGSLEAALRAIQGSNNPEKYVKEIKIAKAALQKLNAYKAVKATGATTSSTY